MIAAHERRLRAIRARILVRRSEYRQRDRAAGVWFRLRRFLTFAKEAYVVSDQEADLLIAEGHRPDPVGFEVAPPKILLRIPAERLNRLPSRRAIPVSLGPEFLAARAIVTVGFDP